MGIQERKERERGARREEIISAAEAVFFEKGLALSTVDEIAEKAELSKGTIYLYYKSKEDLFVEVAYRGMEILSGMFKRAVGPEQPTMKRIAGLGDAYLAFFKQHREYFRMMNLFDNPSLMAQVSPDVRQKCTESERRLWDLVIGLIRLGIEEGLLHRDLDPVEVGVMLWSNSNGLMRLMDRSSSYWSDVMHLDLEQMLGKSNALLVEGMMTDRAKELFPPFTMFYHRTDNEPPQPGRRAGGEEQQ
jgi:AcrR family transcriptional regulator